MRAFRFNLTVSILAFLSCLLLLTWLLFSLFAFKTAANDLYAQRGEHARALLSAFIDQLPEVVPTFPNGMILPDSTSGLFAQKLVEEGVFTRLSLLDANGKIIFTAGKEGSDIFLPFSGAPQQQERGYILPGGSGITLTIPVVKNGTTVGKAGIVLPLAAENARLQRSQTLFMAYFAIDFILLLGFGSYILSRIVVSPINRLLTATEKITGGHYGQRVAVSGSTELARLAEAFNEMSETLLFKDQEVSAHVTALEKANRELRQAREEALRSEKMASIGLLAAGMAHEIGTPLASIMGYADLLATEQTEICEINDYSRRISQDCARIDSIVRGLLDYSRPAAGVVSAADIRGLVDESIELLARQGIFKNIEVSTLFHDTLPMALADPHRLQQVLVNLILNSRDAMPDGGILTISGRIEKRETTSESVAGWIAIDVVDTGSGITSENLKRIFDPFFTTKPPGKGTGLGLAISARIIEGFGGDINVTSEPGRGSRFTLWLPVALEPPS
jgi:two-component system NtrC family sensor kinase